MDGDRLAGSIVVPVLLMPDCSLIALPLGLLRLPHVKQSIHAHGVSQAAGSIQVRHDTPKQGPARPAPCTSVPAFVRAETHAHDCKARAAIDW